MIIARDFHSMRHVPGDLNVALECALCMALDLPALG